MPRFKPHQSTEKSENFKESITRLIKNLNPWKKTMIIALALAMLSAILALITPDKLSEFADTIGEGLVPKTEVLEKINVKLNDKQIEARVKNFSYRRDAQNADYERKIAYLKAMNKVEER